MPRHRPIRFKAPSFSEEAKEYIGRFTQRHPIASSTTKALLAMAILGVGLTVAVTAPGIVSVWSHSAASRKRAQKARYNQLWQSFYQLKRDKSVVYKGEKNGEAIYEFTSKGQKKIRNFLLDALEILPPRKWDGEWRVIIFDIPEKYRRARQALQSKLADTGCFQLQKSVWVHPFPCEKEVEFLKEFFNIKPFVHILQVKEMTDGKTLYHFKELLEDVI